MKTLVCMAISKLIRAVALLCLLSVACRSSLAQPSGAPVLSKSGLFSLDGQWTHERSDAGRTQSVDARLGDRLVEVGAFESDGARLSCLRFADGRLLAFAQKKATDPQGGWVVVDTSSGRCLDWQPVPQAGPVSLDRDRIVLAMGVSTEKHRSGVVLVSRSIGATVANWEVAVEEGVGSIALCAGNEGEPANVIIATAPGRAACYQGATGARVWLYRTELAGVVTNRAASPVRLAVAGGKVFLPTGDQMDVLDAATGDQLGSAQGNLPVVSVASDGGKAYFTFADSLNAYCLYGMTATWSFPEFGEEPRFALQPMQHLATQYSNPAWVPRIGPPSVSDNHLMFVDGHAVFCVSRRGELEWRTPIGDEPSGSEAGESAALRLVAQTADGKGVVVHGRCVDLYGVSNGKLVMRIPFESVVDDVIVLQSHILVSERGKIHCLGDAPPAQDR